MTKAIGRPKGSKNRSTILREEMQEQALTLFRDGAEKAVMNIMGKIHEGDLETSKWFVDKILSKAPTKSDAEEGGQSDEPFTVNINIVPSANHGEALEGEVVDVQVESN